MSFSVAVLHPVSEKEREARGSRALADLKLYKDGQLIGSSEVDFYMALRLASDLLSLSMSAR